MFPVGVFVALVYIAILLLTPFGSMGILKVTVFFLQEVRRRMLEPHLTRLFH